MAFLLLAAIVSLVLVIGGTVHYGFPTAIVSRAILAIWILAITFFLGEMAWQLWAGPRTQGVRGSQKPFAPSSPLSPK